MSTSKVYNFVRRYHIQRVAFDDTHPNGYPPEVSNITRTFQSDVTYGGNYKDWKQRIARGLDCTTLLTGHRRGHVISRGGDITQYKSGKRYQTYSGDLAAGYNASWSTYTPTETNDVVADQRARSKFLKHYISARNDWRGGNFLAEIRETLHALRNPVKALYQRTWTHAGNMRRLRKVYKQDPFVLRKHLADAHLGYAFGVKPLISDINDATTALNNVGSHEGSHDTHRVSGYGRNTSVSKDVSDGGAFGVGGGVATSSQFERFVKTDNSTRYTAAIIATCGTGRQDLQRLGLDPFDLLPAIWEGTYLSFLVDYFANVGEVLDSWRLWDANVAWCKVTVRNSKTLNVTNLHIIPHPTQPTDTYAIGGNPGLYALSQYVSRAPTSIPSPNFHFQMPDFPDMKWLNIAALSNQMFGSKYHYKIGV